MKNIKLVLGVIAGGLIVVFAFQNQDVLTQTQRFRFNLGVMPEYVSSELPAAVLFLAFFLMGFIVAYIMGLGDRFRARRTVRGLRQTVESQKGMLADLQARIDALAPPSAPAGQEDATTVEVSAPE